MLDDNPLQAGCNLTIVRGGLNVITCLLVLQEISIWSVFVTDTAHGLDPNTWLEVLLQKIQIVYNLSLLLYPSLDKELLNTNQNLSHDIKHS